MNLLIQRQNDEIILSLEILNEFLSINNENFLKMSRLFFKNDKLVSILLCYIQSTNDKIKTLSLELFFRLSFLQSKLFQEAISPNISIIDTILSHFQAPSYLFSSSFLLNGPPQSQINSFRKEFLHSNLNNSNTFHNTNNPSLITSPKKNVNNSTSSNSSIINTSNIDINNNSKENSKDEKEETYSKKKPIYFIKQEKTKSSIKRNSEQNSKNSMSSISNDEKPLSKSHFFPDFSDDSSSQSISSSNENDDNVYDIDNGHPDNNDSDNSDYFSSLYEISEKNDDHQEDTKIDRSKKEIISSLDFEKNSDNSKKRSDSSSVSNDFYSKEEKEFPLNNSSKVKGNIPSLENIFKRAQDLLDYCSNVDSKSNKSNNNNISNNRRIF